LEEFPPMNPTPATSVSNSTPELARAWHVVATTPEVGSEPRQVWLLGQPWCLVRLPDGTVAAWADRCPHRLAPLSAGRLQGSEIQCGYHGWRFGADGRCRAIPAIGDRQPPGRAEASVPWAVDERHGLVWLAPQKPLGERHPFPEWDDPAFDRAMSRVVRTPASAPLLVDNFLDAAHFPFVHSASFGVDEASEVHDRGVTRRGWQVETTFETWYREKGTIQRQLLSKIGGPSLTVKLRLDFPDTGVSIAILFCCTPEKPGQSRVYKLLAHNGLGGDPAQVERFVAEEDQILLEDLSILERYDHDEVFLDRRVELHTRADRLSLAWRAVMADLLAAVPAASPAEATPPTLARALQS
jgi:phenylpropionate dioxygenase-like ring-hydroxylating dioxygenase large terminal subunit